jgi:hypothetical protein
MISVEILDQALGGGLPSDAATLLQELEAAAVDYVQKRTKAWFGAESTEIVELKNGTGTQQVLLDNDPASITSVEIRGKLSDARPYDTGTEVWVTVNSGDYFTQGNRLIYYRGGWPVGEANMRVTYLAGYEQGQEPPLIRKAIIDLVGHWYLHRPMVRATDETEETSIPESVNLLLDQWMERREEQVLLPRLRRM